MSGCCESDEDVLPHPLLTRTRTLRICDREAPGGEKRPCTCTSGKLNSLFIDSVSSSKVRWSVKCFDNVNNLSTQLSYSGILRALTKMDDSCATCAQRYDSALDPASEKPLLPGRDLECCGRSICSRCLNQNKRYETYCPYCQITTEPSALPQGLRDPPAYSEADKPPSNIDDEPPAYSARSEQLPSEKAKEDEPAPDVLHFLTPNDSMHSLGLAYGVPVNALRKTNNVYADNLLQGRRTVLIPGEYYKGGVSLSPRPLEGEEEEMKKQKIRRWMVGCKVAE